MLILKGKKLGFSDLHIWAENKGKISYKIYVFSKRQRLKIISLMETFQGLGLKAKFFGDKIYVRGTIYSLKNYHLIKHLIKDYKNDIIYYLVLSKKIKKHIIGKIYYHLFQNNIRDIKCHPQNFLIQCEYAASSIKKSRLIKFLEKKYAVQLVPKHNKDLFHNFTLKIKFYWVSRNLQNDQNFGMSEMNGKFMDVVNENLSHLFYSNAIALQKGNYYFKHLASPQITLTLNEWAKLKVGEEKFFNETKDKWKFVGLNFSFKLQKKFELFFLEYKMNLEKKKKQKNYYKNNHQSKVFLNLNTPLLLLDHHILSKQNYKEKTPFLSAIPVVGNFFTGHGDNQQLNKLMAIIELKKYSYQKNTKENNEF